MARRAPGVTVVVLAALMIGVRAIQLITQIERYSALKFPLPSSTTSNFAIALMGPITLGLVGAGLAAKGKSGGGLVFVAMLVRVATNLFAIARLVALNAPDLPPGAIVPKVLYLDMFELVVGLIGLVAAAAWWRQPRAPASLVLAMVFFEAAVATIVITVAIVAPSTDLDRIALGASVAASLLIAGAFFTTRKPNNARPSKPTRRAG